MPEIIKEYEAQLDSEKRITLRDVSSEFYHVREFEDGTIELIPATIIQSDEISISTLGMIDSSVKNLKEGRVSGPVNFSKINDTN